MTNWDAMPASVDDLFANKTDVEAGNNCQAEPCEFVWQTMRINPENRKFICLCWKHAHIWDDHYGKDYWHDL